MIIIATQSIQSQFKEIEKEVINMARGIAMETAKEVPKDLKEVHKQIMDDFYGSYTPRVYVRTNNLKNNSPIEQQPIGVWDTYDAGLVVGSFGMHDNYNISPDNVFDLMWNKGVRGLPKVRSAKKENAEGWKNPFWQSKYGEINNVFRTSATLHGYSSGKGTPTQVMEDIVNHWKEAGGESACDRAKNKIVGKY